MRERLIQSNFNHTKRLACDLVDFYHDFDPYDYADNANGDTVLVEEEMFVNLQKPSYAKDLLTNINGLEDDIPDDMQVRYQILQKELQDYVTQLTEKGCSFDAVLRNWQATGEEPMNKTYRRGEDELSCTSVVEESNGRIRRKTCLYENGDLLYGDADQAIYPSKDCAMDYLKDKYQGTQDWHEVAIPQIELQETIAKEMQTKRPSEGMFAHIMERLQLSREDTEYGQ